MDFLLPFILGFIVATFFFHKNFNAWVMSKIGRKKKPQTVQPAEAKPEQKKDEGGAIPL